MLQQLYTTNQAELAWNKTIKINRSIITNKVHEVSVDLYTIARI